MAHKTIFTTDKAKKSITVERIFVAPLKKVWDAWTRSEILDQWWAPKPYRAQTKRMNFQVGGYWLYAMVAPDGTHHWSRVDFIEIDEPGHIGDKAFFCNEEGQINTDLPLMHWSKTFTASSGSTIVRCELTFEEVDNMEKIIAMGFEGGFKMGLDNLAAYFETNNSF